MSVVVVDHPLITHKLSILRDREISTGKFRDVVGELTLLLTYEACRDLPMRDCEVETPICTMKTQMLDKDAFIIAPILRAGLGMVPGMLSIFPVAKVAHIGLERDEETALPRTYYFNAPPNLEGCTVILVDPMLATGGSLSAAIKMIKQRGAERIKAICLLGAPEGKARMDADHPDVQVYVGAMDERLNEKAYIVPGLGDAGDRMFGTI